MNEVLGEFIYVFLQAIILTAGWQTKIASRKLKKETQLLQ